MLKHKLGERRAIQKIQNVCPKLTCISFGPSSVGGGGRGYTKGTGPFIQRQTDRDVNIVIMKCIISLVG